MGNKQLKIGDIVELPPVKTVVQLSDLQNSQLRESLLESFVITAEVEKNLKAILHTLNRQKGQGVFVEGNYGSGKSHFLTVLATVLENPATWEILTADKPELHALSLPLREVKIRVLTISLVEHSGQEHLEEIVTRRAVEQRLLTTQTARLPRRERFQQIFEQLKRENAYGLVVLIDELSEYLRSKPDARSFNEEIRFLQYLGELSLKQPLWLIATLQERIEDTGEISQETFNKIKDRYPVRLFLGTHHVEELISQRLVRKKGDEATRKILQQLYQRMKTAFETLPISEEKFIEIYPVHPATIEFLDNLKRLFSQHRGVVDFIHYQLRGDERRGIPGFLNKPADSLLTPDFIFDHFQVRIKETVELNPYLEVVYRYWEKQIPRFFEHSHHQQVALRLIKLLILAAISPREMQLNVRQLTNMLLHRITELDSQMNYQFVADVLKQMYREGAYLDYHQGETPADDVYTVDLQANVNVIVQRKIEKLISELEEHDARIYRLLEQDFSEPFLKLKEFTEQPVSEEEYLWQQTTRRGWRIYRDLRHLTEEELKKIAGDIHSARADFLILIGSPGGADWQKKHHQEVLHQQLASLNLLAYTIVWLPEPIQSSAVLREYYAVSVLVQRYQDDHSATGRQMFQFLSERRSELKRRVRELVTNAYASGDVRVADYPERFDQLGLLPYDRFMTTMVDRLLTRRFPKHQDIAPYSPIYTTGRVQEAIRNFFLPGGITIEEADSSLRATIENYLKPLGLLSRSSGRYLLRVEPRHSPLLQYLLDFIEQEPVETEYLFIRAHHSPYGISREQFQFLLLAILFSGNAVAYSHGRKLPPEQISGYKLERITAVARGNLIDERTVLALKNLPLVDNRLLQQKFSSRVQEKIYQQIKEQLAWLQEALQFVRRELEQLRNHPVLASLPMERWQRLVENLSTLLQRLKLGANSREGLQHIVEILEGVPLFGEQYQELHQVVQFLREHRQGFEQISVYLNHPDLVIPEQPEYRELQQMRTELMEMLQQPQTVTEHIPQLFDRFREFQKEYVARYLVEHEQFRGEQAFGWLEEIRNSRLYRALRQLSTLRSVEVHPSAGDIEQQLNRLRERICRQSPQEWLRMQPVCQCGFHLGEGKMKTIAPGQLNDLILQALKNYVVQLRNPQIQKQVEEFRQKVEKLSQKKKLAALQAFRKIQDEKELVQFVESGQLPVLKEALEDKLVIHEFSVDEFMEPFLNRLLDVNELQQALSQKLRQLEQGDRQVYVRLVKGKIHPGEQLSYRVATVSPFVYNLFPDWSDENWRHLLMAAHWFAEHQMPIERLPELLEIDLPAEMQDDFLREIKVLVKEIPVSELGELPEQALIDWFEKLYQNSEYHQIREFVRKEQHFVGLVRHSLDRALRLALNQQIQAEKLDWYQIFRSPERSDHLIAHHLLQLLPQLFLLRQKVEKHLQGDLSRHNASWWNYIYTQEVFALPYLMDLIRRYLRMFDMQSYLYDTLMTLREQVTVLSENFQSVFPVLITEVLENSRSPISITRLLPVLLRRVENERPILIWIDGLRWDMWEVLHQRFLAGLFPELKRLTEYAVWTVVPSNTETVMAKLVESLGQLPFQEDSVEDRQQPIARLSEEIELVPGVSVHKINAVDSKIHTSRDDLTVFASEVLLQLRTDLERFFSLIPEGRRILLFSDHGFIENPNFRPSNKYQQHRYQHGGSSPFEIIVPAVLLEKVSQRKSF